MKSTTTDYLKRVLTVAGSDSGGGAGIQADLKTMHQLGVYGMSVVTAVTAQNTQGVGGVQAIAGSLVQQQLSAVFDDFGIDAMKTGMLANADIVTVVAAALTRWAHVPIVVDPVMVAKGGTSLLTREAIAAVREQLLPLARVVTPNLPEASALVGYSVISIQEAEQAARDIAAWGPAYVVVKGGHRGTDTDVVDVVYASGRDAVFYLSSPYIASRNTHGTGCTFSSAVAALLGQGWETEEALAGAKAFVAEAILAAKTWTLGLGYGPISHFALAPRRFYPEWGVINRYENGQWTLRHEGRR